MEPDTETVTKKDADALLRFLPALEQDWPPADMSQIDELYSTISDDPWLYGDYMELAKPLLESAKTIASAGTDGVRAMLTFIYRGERYCPGFFEMAVRSGQLRLILLRLQELHTSLPDWKATTC